MTDALTTRRLLSTLLLAGTLVVGMRAGAAWATPDAFSFAVIAPPSTAVSSETVLAEAIAQSNHDKPAFVVVNGIKANTEPCTDSLYQNRKSLLAEAKSSVVVSIAASDWVGCKNAKDKPSEIGRLNRLRELFFADNISMGSNKMPLARQSDTAKFRSYPENAHWQVADVLFATINLPSDNNHYLPEAGRNSEFEDRAIANRDWLARVFTLARRKKMAGIVLFCDGNPLSVPSRAKISSLKGRRDGFIEVRQQLSELNRKFPGKVLLVHRQNQTKPATGVEIVWQGKIGAVALDTGLIKLNATRKSSALFSIDQDQGLKK